MDDSGLLVGYCMYLNEDSAQSWACLQAVCANSIPAPKGFSIGFYGVNQTDSRFAQAVFLSVNLLAPTGWSCCRSADNLLGLK